MNLLRRPVRFGFFLGAVLFLLARAATADIVATGFFSGTIERFDAETGNRSTLTRIEGSQELPQNPGLSGIAYDSASSRLYVSALQHGGIYTVDARSGSLLGFNPLSADSSFTPSGLALGPDGLLYVGDFASNSVGVFDTSFASRGSISVGAETTTSGVGFLGNGDMIISTSSAGLFRYDGNSVTSFAGQVDAAGQVAVDSNNNVYVGHGVGFSNNVHKFDSDGNQVGDPFLAIDETLLPPPDDLGSQASAFTNPSGVTLDAEGNLIVAALGRTNPSGDPNGGLFKLAPDGTGLQTIGTGLTPLSSVTTIPTAIPEAGSVAFLSAVGLVAGVVIRRRAGRPRV